MKTKRTLIYAIIFLSIFLIIYLTVFHNGLSSNHNDWGSFGSYIGGIGGVILSCSLFYYTYIIDKNRRKYENDSTVLHLLDIVGKSLVYLERWEKLNFELDNHSIYEIGEEKHDEMKNERDGLEIQIKTNYKKTQVLANRLYGMDIPNVDYLYQTKSHFEEVFERIKK